MTDITQDTELPPDLFNQLNSVLYAASQQVQFLQEQVDKLRAGSARPINATDLLTLRDTLVQAINAKSYGSQHSDDFYLGYNEGVLDSAITARTIVDGLILGDTIIGDGYDTRDEQRTILATAMCTAYCAEDNDASWFAALDAIGTAGYCVVAPEATAEMLKRSAELKSSAPDAMIWRAMARIGNLANGGKS